MESVRLQFLNDLVNKFEKPKVLSRTKNKLIEMERDQYGHIFDDWIQVKEKKDLEGIINK